MARLDATMPTNRRAPSTDIASLPRAPSLVVAHFPEIQTAHRDALERGTVGPFVVLADHRCPHGVAVIRACFKEEPTASRVFIADAAGLLAMLHASTPPFLSTLKRALEGAPEASAQCMRVMVFADARVSLTPYVYTPSPRRRSTRPTRKN